MGNEQFKISTFRWKRKLPLCRSRVDKLKISTLNIQPLNIIIEKSFKYEQRDDSIFPIKGGGSYWYHHKAITEK